MARSLMLSLLALAPIAAGCESPQTAREKGHCAGTLRGIGLGAESLKDLHGKPCWQTPIVGKAGLSWRVELMPFIEQDNLYRVLKEGTDDFSIPLFTADGTPTPNRSKARTDLNNRVYHYTHNNPAGTTAFRRVPWADRPDAFVVVETTDHVPWGPAGDDLIIEADKPLPKMGGNFKGGFLALCADGKVRWIPSSLSKEATIAALFDGKGGKEM
jgi:hypothetical protein